MTTANLERTLECDGCGQPGPVGKFNNSKYCPKCHRENVLYLGAKNALHIALAELTATWSTHWEAIGLTANETHSILEGVNLAKLDERIQP
jgi:hypothetical protein